MVLIEFLEGPMHFLARLCIVVPGDPFHHDIAKHVLVCMCLWEVPTLQRVPRAILLITINKAT
jgi:hypothetical protein